MFQTKNIILALCLCLPMLVFFAGYGLNHVDGLSPTGFIQYDNVSYLAYAKQYLDHPETNWQYANPFNDGDNYSRIYFQVQSFFFAILLKLGIPVSWILPLFTLICSFFCFLLLIGIFDHLVKDGKGRKWIIWLFAWGGGLFVLAGALYHFISNPSASLSADLFTLDPEYGWWGLNLGRSLFFSCEAYYHLLFLASIYFLLKRKYLAALIALFLLILSHPFSGIELAGIIACWALIEWLFNSKNIPSWFVLGSFILAAFHIWYYLVYLEQFAEHQSVREQYSLTWGLRWYRMLPAYGLVAALAIGSCIKIGWKDYFSKRENRIFLCWFGIAMLLANHDLFIEPKQPIHFTRGYIWTSLFLLGWPALKELTDKILLRRNYILAALLTLILLLDNFTWIFMHAKARATHPGTDYITKEQKDLFSVMNENSTHQTLVISSNTDLAYLSSVYSRAYPLYSHPFTTPFAERKKQIHQEFLSTGKLDSSLEQREIILILSPSDTLIQKNLLDTSWQPLYQSDNYLLFKKQP